MSKKTIAIIVEAIPLVIVTILGILDWFATLVTFQLYAIAIFSFGL